jgi:hypothetical protein
LNHKNHKTNILQKSVYISLEYKYTQELRKNDIL